MDLLLHFFKTDAGFAAAFSVVSTITIALIGHLVRDRVRLIWFSPQSAIFNVKQKDPSLPTIYVNAGRIVVQNQGKKTANNVQITSLPGAAPAGYAILPSVVHSTRLGEQGEWIVEIPYLAPLEVITLEILNGPQINSVRCEEVGGRLVPVIHQRAHSKVAVGFATSMMIIGVISTLFLVGWALAALL